MNLILIIIVSLVFFVILFFMKSNSALKLQHIEKIKALQNKIIVNKQQVDFRMEGLNSYNLMEYNLNDSLRVQSEINLI